MTNQETCPLCEKEVERHNERSCQGLDIYSRHDPCGKFCIFQSDRTTLSEATQRDKWQPARIIALLCERRLRNGNGMIPLLLLQMTPQREIPGTEPLRVAELLALWPDSVPERIERSFLTLVRRIGVGVAGREVSIKRDELRNYVPFAIDEDEAVYLLNSMQGYGWTRQSVTSGSHAVHVTPEGWAKFDEITRTQSSKRNPAFVAMWFGHGKDKDKDESEKMTRLYEAAIKPAIMAAGYGAKRADTDEHNEPIMDRVIEDIRQAPFVVAELSDDNNGVYYEAGFAKGRGTDVIHCCRPRDGHKPHFDVSGINIVMWKDDADLRKRLENRILGSVGRGPYDFGDVRKGLPGEK